MCLSNGRYSDYAKLITETARHTLKISSKPSFLKLWAKLLVKAERCAELLKASFVSFAYVRGAVAEVNRYESSFFLKIFIEDFRIYKRCYMI